jgi:hypothetical protein
MKDRGNSFLPEKSAILNTSICGCRPCEMDADDLAKQRLGAVSLVPSLDGSEARSRVYYEVCLTDWFGRSALSKPET